MHEWHPVRAEAFEYSGQISHLFVPQISLFFLQVELDDLTIENAYFRSFEIIVRKQLDPVWHKVGPKTKQLVNDLGTLRLLL